MRTITPLLIYLVVSFNLSAQNEETRVVVESYYDTLLNAQVKLILHNREGWGEGDNTFSLQIDTETHGRETIMANGGALAISRMGEHLEGIFTPDCNASRHKLNLLYKDTDGTMLRLHIFKLNGICR